MWCISGRSGWGFRQQPIFGWRQVATAYGAVTHDDCLMRRDWLERLERRLLKESDAVVTGRVEPEGEACTMTRTRAILDCSEIRLPSVRSRKRNSDCSRRSRL